MKKLEEKLTQILKYFSTPFSDLSPDGSISNKRLFYKFADGGMDGMKCDIHGNIYVTRLGCDVEQN